MLVDENKKRPSDISDPSSAQFSTVAARTREDTDKVAGLRTLSQVPFLVARKGSEQYALQVSATMCASAYARIFM